MARAEEMPRSPSFREALSGSATLGVIAEIKRRSPSRGRLAADLDVSALAGRYAAGGAVAISVLTEPAFFDGDPSDLAAAQESSGLPVLRKDFILESLQVWEARAMGASAVLLIAAALTPNELVALLDSFSEALTTEDLTAMNARADLDQEDPALIAEEWLTTNGFVE